MSAIRRTYLNELDADQIADLPNYEIHEKKWLDRPQPLRTDLETRLTGKGFVEVTIEPAEGWRSLRKRKP